MINYNDITRETVVSHEWSGKRAELAAALTAGEEVIGFVGGAEVPASRLTKLVPEGLPFSSKQVFEEFDHIAPIEVIDEETGEIHTESVHTMKLRPVFDENGDGAFEQKTWGEYAIVSESITEGEYLLTAVDYVSESKCHSGTITSENLHLWANDVGVSNMRTKSEFNELRKPSTDGGL